MPVDEVPAAADESDEDEASALLDEALLPLPALFARGYAAHREAESGGGGASREVVEGGVRSLRAASAAVRALALFSPNETLADVSTPTIKYLLLPFLLAEARSARVFPPCRRLSRACLRSRGAGRSCWCSCSQMRARRSSQVR